MAARFEESKQYKFAKTQLINNLKTALNMCKFNIIDSNEDQGLFQAKTGFNIWSWSEYIDVEIEENGTITIKSECSMPTQIVDWGKNKRNVKKIFKLLDELNKT